MAAEAGQAPPVQPPAPPAARRRRLPSTMKTWVAAVIGAVLLLGGGIGGYFIGAANDHDNNSPGIGRHYYGPDGPGARQLPPFRDGGRGGR